jgi:hypothetical protein
MPIQVVCSGCKTRFSVSEQYAGRTGPCPKCKKPITIPKPAVDSVVIHEPERVAGPATAPGAIPLKPLPKRDRPVPIPSILAILAGLAITLAASWGIGRAWAGSPPWTVQAIAAAGIAIPCVLVGYAMVRDRDLEPWRGRNLLLRAAVCAAVYAGLWGVRGFLPEETVREMWQWLVVGPFFVFAGALAALASLEIDWGPAVVHYSLYLLVTATMRWLAGLSPL